MNASASAAAVRWRLSPGPLSSKAVRARPIFSCSVRICDPILGLPRHILWRTDSGVQGSSSRAVSSLAFASSVSFFGLRRVPSAPYGYESQAVPALLFHHLENVGVGGC